MSEQKEAAQRLAAAGDTALIERWFPYRELSLVAQADRRVSDSKYAAHTWWARRPPGVFRGILLAAALKSDTPPREYWKAFETPDHWLEGLTIADDFAGGGTTVVEASRLGAHVLASDIDPLAVEIVKHQLATVSKDEVRQASVRLLRDLSRHVGHLFGDDRGGWTPVHNFYLRNVTCPVCEHESPVGGELAATPPPAADRVRHSAAPNDTRERQPAAF